MKLETFEGTWEEIQAYADVLSGHQVRVMILNSEVAASIHHDASERVKRRKALEEFCEGSDDFSGTPLLSPEDLSRETLYGLR